MNKLELIQLSKTYGQKIVIKELSLKVQSGEFFVILGPSGEGKSTLLKMIAGIERPSKGNIIIDGKDVTDLPPDKRNIAMVFQSFALYPNMSVRQNIEFPLKMRHLSKQAIEAKVKEALLLFNIEDIADSSVAKISGGQKQRVALARATVREPSLFLLDEPLSNLDARARFVARGELKRIQQTLGQTFIYVTHDQKEAASLATRVAVLHKGVFEQIGTFYELVERPKTRWIGEFVGEFPMSFIPGSMMGLDDSVEIGFHPHWVSEGVPGINCEVESVEAVGNDLYLFCSTDRGVKVIIKAANRRQIGEKTSFRLDKYLTFKNENRIDSNN
ncbi:MAG: ABC transporter ATP-binding protein [Nitrososphaerota archaeon]